MSWTARVRAADLTLGDPVEFASLTLVENYGLPDALSIDGYLDDIRPALFPSAGIVVTDDAGQQRFSGILGPDGIERRGDGTGTLAYVADTAHLWWRLCWPDPASTWASQGAAYDVQTGTAEAKIIGYASRNLGSAARAERRLARLRLPASADRGPSAKMTARFQILGQLVKGFAESANLRVRIVQAYDPDPWLDLIIEPAPDLSGWARFGDVGSGGPGVLAEDWRYKLGRPTGTTILSAAGGEGTARVLTASTDTAAESLWNARVETFIDQRGTTDAGEISRGIADAMASNVGASEITAPLGLSGFDIGTEIPVGAQVAAILDGEPVTDRLRQITTSLSGGGVEVKGVIGDPDAGLQSPTQRRLAEMLRRILNLERAP